MDVIPGLYSNIFSLKQALKRGTQITSEGDTLILKESCTNTCFGKKMTNIDRQVFIVTAKFIE